MLRYVSRRIKDSVERTCNVLEARRTWTYGNEGIGVFDGCNQSSSDRNKHFQRRFDQRSENLFEFGLEPKVPILKKKNVVNKKVGHDNLCQYRRRFVATDTPTDSGSSSDKEDFKERIHHKHQCRFQKSFIEALTWSSALICGWYTSQVICMRRRYLQNGWSSNGQCKYAKVLMQPSQAFHSSVLSHWAKAAPDHQQSSYIWKFNEDNVKFRNDTDFYKENIVEPVNYDHLKSGEKISTEAKQDVIPKSFDDAVHNLLHILGDIEFQLGVANVHSNRFDLAVSHFKLATSHSHASAAYNLGVCYEEGIGIGKNLKMALECYMIASSLGHAKALYNVGIFHAHGLANLPKNRKAARQYFKEAAKLGLNEANQALGYPQMKAIAQTIVPKVTNDHQSQPVAVAI